MPPNVTAFYSKKRAYTQDYSVQHGLSHIHHGDNLDRGQAKTLILHSSMHNL